MKKFGSILLGLWPFLLGLIIMYGTIFATGILYVLIYVANMSGTGVDPMIALNSVGGSIENSANYVGVSMSLAAAINILVMGLIYFYARRNRISAKVLFHPSRILSVILIAVGFQVVISFVLTFVYSLLPDLVNEYIDRISTLDYKNSFLILAYTVVLGPVAEELIFRGVLLQNLRKEMPFFAANIIQAILFGVYHGDVIQGSYAFVIGLIFGYVFKKNGNNILASILLHILFNGMSVGLSYTALDTLEINDFISIAILGIGAICAIWGMYGQWRIEEVTE